MWKYFATGRSHCPFLTHNALARKCSGRHGACCARTNRDRIAIAPMRGAKDREKTRVTTGTGPTASSRAPGADASDKRLFAIVLAAGSSSRFGSSKQLVTYGGAPLVTRAVRLAESICGSRSVLVSGHQWRPVVEACRPLQGFFVNNTRHRTGMGSSIACGVRSVTGAADAVLLLLADQPLITASHLEQLVSTWTRSPDEITAASFAETAGPPVIFPRRYFTGLGKLQGDRGAREILTSAGSDLRTVKLEEAAADIDEPEDIDRLP